MVPPAIETEYPRVCGRLYWPWLVTYVVVVLFFATLIRSTLGFGEALVAVPLLALRTPVAIAAPLAVLMSIVVATVIVLQDWQRIDFRSAGGLVVATLFGIPLGVLLLAKVNDNLVKLVLGAVIIAFSLYSLIGKRRHLPVDHIGWLMSCGFLAGVLGGAYGMNGPPLAVYGSLRRWSPQQFRATLQGYFLPASVIGMIGYASIGLWNETVTKYFLWSLPGVVVAVAIGRFINHRMPTHGFFRFVYGGLLVVGAILLAQASLRAAQSAPAPTCREWHECQRLALDAYSRGEYEQFHDLAWRTVQTGPPRNPELMYMLARAQSLSGRPHDALVMLERLAEMKFKTAAATDDDFKAVRQLRQWPEFEATTAPATRPADAAPSVSARPPDLSPPSVTPPAVSPPVATPPHHGEEALRIPGTNLGSAGLAYDRVSSRFVVADADRRKLVIIDERSRHLIDLVTSDSAGFDDITGFEIDPARGDLWVVSAKPPECALHKLQLVSGRPLERIPLPAELQPCSPADVAVTSDGRVLVLDAATPRLLRYRSHTFTTIALPQLESPTSVAPANDRIVYVSHASGIARVDTVTGAVEGLSTSHDLPLGGFERIRWARDSLVGVQHLSDGSQRAVRIKIAEGRATAMEVIDNDVTATDHPVATVSGNEFYVLVHQRDGDTRDLVIRRSRLR